MTLTLAQAYRQLVADIGPGFHPDTPGDEYLFLPEGYTPQRVDSIVRGGREVCDVYDVALEVLGVIGYG